MLIHILIYLYDVIVQSIHMLPAQHTVLQISFGLFHGAVL